MNFIKDNIDWYMNQISNFPFLSKQEMLECGKTIYEKNKEINKLVYRSKHLPEKIKKIYRRRELENKKKDMKDGKTDWYILGIGEVEFKKLMNTYISSSRYKEKGRKETYTKIIKAYEILKETKNKLVLGYVKRTYQLALRFKKASKTKHLQLEDLLQVGNEALIKSSIFYDHTLGFNFSTWVEYRIRQRIIREIAKHEKEIRIPTHISYILEKINQAKNSLIAENKNPTYEEISKITGLPKKLIEKEEKNYQITKVASLNTEVNKNDDKSLYIAEIIPDKKENGVERLINSDLSERIREILKTSHLRKKEKEILRMRYGIERKKSYTLREIGGILGVSRERIRQIQETALKKIQKNHEMMSKLKEIYNQMTED